MRRVVAGWLILTSVVLALTGAGAQAEELSVAMYCDLSLARLQLAKDMLEQEQRSPTVMEQEVLWQRYGTTAEEYLVFGSLHRDEVDGYLAAHLDVRDEIERVSAELDDLIAQGEGSP